MERREENLHISICLHEKYSRGGQRLRDRGNEELTVSSLRQKKWKADCQLAQRYSRSEKLAVSLLKDTEEEVENCQLAQRDTVTLLEETGELVESKLSACSKRRDGKQFVQREENMEN